MVFLHASHVDAGHVDHVPGVHFDDFHIERGELVHHEAVEVVAHDAVLHGQVVAALVLRVGMADVGRVGLGEIFVDRLSCGIRAAALAVVAAELHARGVGRTWHAADQRVLGGVSEGIVVLGAVGVVRFGLLHGERSFGVEVGVGHVVGQAVGLLGSRFAEGPRVDHPVGGAMVGVHRFASEVVDGAVALAHALEQIFAGAEQIEGRDVGQQKHIALSGRHCPGHGIGHVVAVVVADADVAAVVERERERRGLHRALRAVGIVAGREVDASRHTFDGGRQPVRTAFAAAAAEHHGGIAFRGHDEVGGRGGVIGRRLGVESGSGEDGLAQFPECVSLPGGLVAEVGQDEQVPGPIVHAFGALHHVGGVGHGLRRGIHGALEVLLVHVEGLLDHGAVGTVDARGSSVEQEGDVVHRRFAFPSGLASVAVFTAVGALLGLAGGGFGRL